MALRRDNMDIKSIFDEDGIIKFEYLDHIMERSLIETL
jgi:hypothetical protein